MLILLIKNPSVKNNKKLAFDVLESTVLYPKRNHKAQSMNS